MKIKALVTMLVLGSSSLALADHASPNVRDHRSAKVFPAPIQAKPLPAPAYAKPLPAPGHIKPIQQFGFSWTARPVLLANNTHLTGRALVQVPARTRPFTKLELRANNGRTNIGSALIVYGNGQRQVVQLGKVVNAKKPLTIDLAGNARHIKSVTLFGNSLRRATIDVLAK